MTARRQKNRGKKVKEWMRACEKRFKYKPEVTRRKRRKNPSTSKRRRNKTNGSKTKALVVVPVSSGQG